MEATDDLAQIANDLLFEGTTWFFRDEPSGFNDVCTHLKKELGASAEILLAGSGSTGYSLSPQKFSRAFRPKSDLDFVIISEPLFDELWSCVRRWAHRRRGFRIPYGENQWLNGRKNDVFFGWITPTELRIDSLTFSDDLNALRDVRFRWSSTLAGVGKAFPGSEIAKHDCKARLYRTREHALDYHSASLNNLRKELIGGT
jgi:hypothetical protein